MMELIQISHAVTNAFLARLSAPKETIAGFSIAFAFNILFGGVAMSMIQTGIGFIKDQMSFRRVIYFGLCMVCVPFLIVEIISTTPFGTIVFGVWMKASPEVVEQARHASFIMGFWAFPICIRNICYSLVMIRRRTILITYATAVRLVFLIFSLVFYSIWFDGAIVGALATVTGMTVEAVYMVFASRSHYAALEKDVGARFEFKEAFSFSWPLMLTQMSENGQMFIVNFFLGQLANPDLAIASFGVVYGLMRLLLAGARNLVQTSQSLVKDREDLKNMLHFTGYLILFYVALIIALFYTPLHGLVLRDLMGLTPEMSAACIPGLRLMVLVAVFWATAALLRGLLSAIRKTFIIAVSGGLRALVVAALGGAALWYTDLNGAFLGILCIGGSFAAETALLVWYFRNQSIVSMSNVSKRTQPS